MGEYIEREAAIAALDEFRLNETVSKYATVMQCKAARDAISRATKALESLPAADVEPVQEWINSEEMLPEYPCLIVSVDRKSVFIPEGILTIKDEHGEWCINASLDYAAKLIDGSEITTRVFENRITHWMPLPEPPKGE